MLRSLAERVSNAVGDAVGIARELVTEHHPREEFKRPVSSSTAAIIRKSSDKVEVEATAIDHFSRYIQSEITGFLDPRKNKKNGNPKYKCSTQSFLSNMTALYTEHATEVAHNLLWHINIDNTLAWLKEHPEYLRMVVKIKDPHGQLVEGTILQIMAAAGERDPCKMEAGEHYGLVELLRPCFSTMPDEYNRQLNEWSQRAKEATEETMAPYVKAIEEWCKKVIDIMKTRKDDKAIDEKVFSTLTEKFREALKPRPDHVVRSGFLFDIGIFLKFFEIWEANIDALGGRWWNTKGNSLSNSFAAIIYPALQERAQRIDQEVWVKGTRYVVEEGQIPDRIDFSRGVPAVLADLGSTSFFGFDGEKIGFDGKEHRLHIANRRGGCALCGANWACVCDTWLLWRGPGHRAFSKLMSSKNISSGLCSPCEFTPRTRSGKKHRGEA